MKTPKSLDLDLNSFLQTLVEDSPWHPSEWETTCLEAGTFHDHLHLKVFKIPEGLLTSASCLRCGGAREHILDLRAASQRTAERLAAGGLLLDGPMTVPEWRATHAECASHHCSHELSGALVEMTSQLVQTARQQLGRGERVAGQVVLLGEEGGSLMGLIPPLPDSGEKRMAVAMWHAATRMAVGKSLDSIKSALTMTECWKGTADDDVSQTGSRSGTEGVILTQTTKSLRRVGWFPIVRDNGSVGKGPGDLKEPKWEPSPWMRMSMGLVASTIEWDEHPNDRRRDVGLRF